MTSLKIVSDHQHLKKKPSLFWNKVNFDDIVAIFLSISTNLSVHCTNGYDLFKTKNDH